MPLMTLRERLSGIVPVWTGNHHHTFGFSKSFLNSEGSLENKASKYPPGHYKDGGDV